MSKLWKDPNMRPGRNPRITVEQWLAKAKKAVNDDGCALARYDDLDEKGEPCFDGRPTRETIASAEMGETGNYVILMDDGTCVAECTIGRSGVRSTPERHGADRQNTMLVTNLSESWERRCNAAERSQEKLEKKIEKLEHKLEFKDLEIEGLKQQLFNATNEDTSEPWRKLAEQAMGLFAGHRTQSQIVQVLSSPGVWDQLSPNAQKEIAALLSSGAVVAAQADIITEAVEGESVQ